MTCRSGLSTDSSKFSYAELVESDDEQDSREERAYRMWINSMGIEYVSSLFEDVRDGYVNDFYCLLKNLRNGLNS